jgi:DNA-binding response OmpR family regulator
MRILLVEDDVDIARFIRKGLVEQSYAVDVATTGEEALYQTSIGVYDGIILDWIIPEPDGMEICRALRAQGLTLPILMLTARDLVSDRIAGLDAGADDYLVKPFEFGELLARVRAMLRRPGFVHKPLLTVGGLEIDTRSHRVRVDGQAVELTTKEYALVEYMARNAGQVVGREEIADHVWNQEFDPFTNLIEVYVNRLRRNFGKVSSKKLIHTIRGAGYMLEERQE